MEVSIIGMKKVKMSETGHQGVMVIVMFGDIPVSESFAVTTIEMARKLNTITKSRKMPQVERWATSTEPKIIFKLKL